jgi:hypothetical protein
MLRYWIVGTVGLGAVALAGGGPVGRLLGAVAREVARAAL